jgi:hypothetical protein
VSSVAIAGIKPVYVLQEVTGELEAIANKAGTLIIDEKPLLNRQGKGNLYYFIFEPKK